MQQKRSSFSDPADVMKRFLFGLLGFAVVWIAGLAPQFLTPLHVSGIIIFALEGLVSIAGYILFVRLIEKRKAAELSRFRVSLLPLGAFVGLVWFALLMLMLPHRTDCFPARAREKALTWLN